MYVNAAHMQPPYNVGTQARQDVANSSILRASAEKLKGHRVAFTKSVGAHIMIPKGSRFTKASCMQFRQPRCSS